MIHAANTPEERRRKILEKINSLKTDIDQGQHRRQLLQLKQWAAHELKTEEPDVVWKHGEDALPGPATPHAQVCTVHCVPRANGVCSNHQTAPAERNFKRRTRCGKPQ